MTTEHFPAVDIAFDCLPLRCITRLDVPLDASDAYRARCLRMKAAIEQHGAEHSYYLYNARCVFRFANSQVEASCRFAFEGVVRTDASDGKTIDADLEVRLASETCGGVPPAVEEWLAQRVKQAVAVEFDRFIASGSHAQRAKQLGKLQSFGDAASFAGMNV